MKGCDPMKESKRMNWKELYNLSIELKDRQPWEYLSDCDFMLVDSEETKVPILVSVMGNAGECYGVSVHPSKQSIQTLMALFEEDRFVVDPLSTPIASQEALTLYFGDREEVSKEQYQVIKKLGFKFRGRGNWIYFKSFHVGEIPQDLNEKEVLFLIDVYKKLLTIIDLIIATPDVSYNNHFLSAIRLVNDTKIETVPISDVYPFLQDTAMKAIPYENELLLHKLRQCKQNNDQLELTYLYPEVSEDKIHFVPLLFGVSDLLGIPVVAEFVQKKEILYDVIFQSLNDYILEQGRPRAIHVRLEDLAEHLADYCQKLGIMLLRDRDLEMTTQVITMAFNQSFNAFDIE